MVSDKKSVDIYFIKTPPVFRAALEKLRVTIRSAAPTAEEGFSYGVPSFKLNGKVLVCYAAFKNHCGFYPMSPEVLAKYSEDLREYDTAKGTIRFQPEKPIPDALVNKIVKERISEIKAGKN